MTNGEDVDGGGSGVVTPAEWAACEDGGLMLKMLGKVSGPPGSDGRRPLVLATCGCARLAAPHVLKGETRPLAAIKMAERWARGEGGVTLKQVRDAAEGAAHAANTAYAAGRDTVAFGASSSTAAARDDASSYATAAYDAAEAARAAYITRYGNGRAIRAAIAALAAGSAAAKASVLRECADIVRRYFPEPPAGARK